MRAPRLPSVPTLVSLGAALAAAVLAGACNGGPPEPSVPAPRSAPAVVAAPPATPAAPAAEKPLVEWPTGENEVAPALPVAQKLPPDPGVQARVDAAPAGAEPLRSPSDFTWEGGKIVARAPTPPSTVPRVRGPVGSATVSGGATGHMWGDEIGDSFGAGGLGLAGVGEGGGGTDKKGSGGGGRGEGIGLGAIGTIGRGAGSGAPSAGFGRTAGPRPSPTSAPGAPRGQDAPGVKAGEWDDNANFFDFRRYLAREADSVPYQRVDLSTRRFLVVRDAEGKPVPNCEVKVEAAGRSLKLLTSSSGRAILFPHAEGVVAPDVVATATCGAAGQATARFSTDAVDGAVDLKVPGNRDLGAETTVDVAFILDTTGSMSEEIDAVKRTVQKVAERLALRKIAVRFALVEYKDRGDEFVVRVHHMTRDTHGFVQRMQRVTAGGGGDMPEDVIEGLRAGLTRVAWSRSSSVRLAFLIGDAPPQLKYGDGTYVDAMRAANRAGIVLHTVAASGMDDMGQVIWRQLAQYTGGTNLFVLRGGAGPQSTGAGDAKSSCGDTHANYASGNLDVLIADKVEHAVSALDADPMRIAGLGQDERAKPCAQRISMQ